MFGFLWVGGIPLLRGHLCQSMLKCEEPRLQELVIEPPVSCQLSSFSSPRPREGLLWTFQFFRSL